MTKNTLRYLTNHLQSYHSQCIHKGRMMPWFAMWVPLYPLMHFRILIFSSKDFSDAIVGLTAQKLYIIKTGCTVELIESNENSESNPDFVVASAIVAVRNVPHLIGSRFEKYQTPSPFLICPCSTTSKLHKEIGLRCRCFCQHLPFAFYSLAPTRFCLARSTMSMEMSWWWTKRSSSKRCKNLKTEAWNVTFVKQHTMSLLPSRSYGRVKNGNRQFNSATIPSDEDRSCT